MAATRSITTTIATTHTSSSVSDRPSPSRVVSAAAVAFSPPRYHAQLGRLRAWSSAAAASVGGFSSSAPFFLGAFADSIMLLGMVRVRISSSSSSSSSLRFRGLGLQAMVAESRSVQQGRSSGSSTSSTSVMMTELLPKKLQEIVKMFEAVPDPRSKYEQLLHYAKQLKPLGKEYLTPENKVQGCVSQVWVRPSVKEDKRFYFEAESDSLLTKGLAALLVEGLSGSTAQEILAVTPDFIQALGLNQSLTPSRSNGFLNMLKLMQKKTLQLYMESEATSSMLSNSVIPVQTSSSSDSSKDTKTDLHKMLESSPPVFEKNSTMSSGGVVTTKKAVIEEKLEEALTPTELEVEDVSYQHAGHSGVERGATETHFNVKVVSESFEGRSLLKRHRLVYDLLKDELQTGGVHALSLITKTPREVSAAGKT
jgi:sulfur transfer protein SufE/stress-induced morphogen